MFPITRASVLGKQGIATRYQDQCSRENLAAQILKSKTLQTTQKVIFKFSFISFFTLFSFRV